MDRKAFLIFLVVLLGAFSFCFAIQRFKPEAAEVPDIDGFPMQKGNWIGQRDDIAPGIEAMLKPRLVFSATYTNENGKSVHLFYDYFTRLGSLSGPHSPRNCMPGSGWSILNQERRTIMANGRQIKAGRFDLGMGESRMIMDFWYITRYGETANDYVFKLYAMAAALTFRPNDVVFVRILSDGDDESVAALDDFEKTFVGEIYDYIGY